MSNPFSYAIGWTIIHSLWQAIIIAAALRLLLMFLPNQRSRLRYSLSLISMVFMLISAMLIFRKSWQDYADQIVPLSSPDSSLMVNEIGQSLSTESTSLIGYYFQMWYTQIEEVIPLLTIAWFIGMLLLAIRMIYAYYQLHDLKRYGTNAVSEEWTTRFERLKQKLGIRREVKILQSEQVGDPITFGFIRPIVLAPVSLFSGLTVEQIEIILLHELAHIRRYDYLINLLQSLMEILFFYHPAIWWISGKIREEREYCCDDLVLSIHNNPILYAEALIQIQSQHFSFKTNLAMSASKKNNAFSHRIHRLFGKYEQKPSLFKGMFILAFIFSSFLLQSNYIAVTAQEAVPQKEVLEKQLSKQKVHIKRDTTAPHLYIIDGVQISSSVENPLENIDPKDIETIDIRKEEAVINKYGEKGDIIKVYVNTKVKGKALKSDHSKAQVKIIGTPSKKKNKQQLTIRDIEIDSGSLTPLYIVDGKTVSEEETKEIAPSDIKSINVFKGESAANKYGEKAQNGVVEIYMKTDAEEPKIKEPKMEPQEKPQEELRKEPTRVRIIGEKSTKDFSPLFVIDGKIVSKKETNDLNPKDIKAINVLKGESAANKYGEKAQNGVVEIYIKIKPPKFKKKKPKKEKKINKRNKVKAKQKEGYKKLPSLKKQPINDFGLNIFPNPSGKKNGPSFKFNLADNARARLDIYNSSGQLIDTIIDQFLDEGNHQTTWKAEGLTAGIYYATLSIGDQTVTKQFVVK